MMDTDNGYGIRMMYLEPELASVSQLWEKFTSKIMVWVAFSELGLDKPFIMESGSMDAYTYRTQCLRGSTTS